MFQNISVEVISQGIRSHVILKTAPDGTLGTGQDAPCHVVKDFKQEEFSAEMLVDSSLIFVKILQNLW